MKHKIVVGMRTKNESWIINKTLKSLSNFCDTVVIYDDGSIDNTEEICRSYEFVDWKVAPARQQYVWNAGQQITNLFKMVSSHNPDYMFILDADEIPTPSVVTFLNNINEDINVWRTRMINLFGDDTHYRIDQYRTRTGININWNPFSQNAWKKYTLIKFDKNFNYSYEPLKIGLGSFGPIHPAPNNIPEPHRETDDFYIMHYGKISPAFMSGEKQRFYAKNDEMMGVGSYESRYIHHMSCSGFGEDEPKTLIKCKDEWFWENAHE